MTLPVVTLAASEFEAVHRLLAFQSTYGIGVRPLGIADVRPYFDSLIGLARDYGRWQNPTVRQWLDEFFEKVLDTPTAYGESFAAMYIVYAYAQFCSLPKSTWVLDGHPWWRGYWDAFVNGYKTVFAPDVFYGPWDRTNGWVDVLWRPTAPAVWRQKSDDLLTRWGSTPPPNIIDVGTTLMSNVTPDTPNRYSELEFAKIKAWSDFPRVQTHADVLWQSEVDAVGELLRPATLDAPSYFFLLHLLAGIATGDAAARRLAGRAVAAPASSAEYPNDTFVNQLLYLVLLYLADPSGAFAYDNAALRQFVDMRSAEVVLRNPASTAMRRSLARSAKLLHAVSSYPLDDLYVPGVSFPQRLADTLAALDRGRATLRR